MTTIPTKLTATQLKGRELDQEIAEGAGTMRRPAAPEKPRFLQAARGLSAAERGTAIHLAMQYLPLDTEPTEEAVRSQVRMLEQRRLLTPRASRRSCVHRWQPGSEARRRCGGSTGSLC